MPLNVQRYRRASAVGASQRSEVLAWDGRIDNRGEILSRLRNSVTPDSTDSELVLAAYEQWGVIGLTHVIGDWSAVIHDAPTHTIVMARDYLGTRPLYYCMQPDDVLWSTRLDALVSAAGSEELDEQYVSGFLVTGGCPNRTPYRGIHVVPAGEAVCIRGDNMRTRPFWSAPTDSIRFRDEREYDEHVRALFREAVRVRLQTDAPVLAELSGGLDSSSVVIVANALIRAGNVPAPSLKTVSFVHRDSLDIPYVREVEAFCGIEGVHLSTHQNRLVSNANVGTARPEPWAPVYGAISTIAQRMGAKILLTGQGGDLVMGNWLDDSLQVAAPLRRGHLGEACRDALAWSKVLRMPVGRILWARGSRRDAGAARQSPCLRGRRLVPRRKYRIVARS